MKKQETEKDRNMNKGISVIVTIYNTNEEYLKRCIESVVNQTLKEIQIILVDDGSTNHAKEICEYYARKDDRIILSRQKNQGESVARNVGIEKTTMSNIIFVDSDDWIEKDTCEKVANFLATLKRDYDILIFNCYVDYTNKSIKNKFYNKNGLLEKEDVEQLQLQNIEKGVSEYYPAEANISSVWAKVYNRNYIQQNSLQFVPNIIRMTDAIFQMEALEKAKRIYVLPEYLYHYQKNNFAVCQRYSNETISYYETYISFVKKYIKEYKKNEKFEDILNIKIITSIDRYMYNYFFHKDNPKKWKETKQEFRELLEKELYQNAMIKVKRKYLSYYQRILLLACKKKNITLLWILKKIKEYVKFLQGKRLKE